MSKESFDINNPLLSVKPNDDIPSTITSIDQQDKILKQQKQNEEIEENQRFTKHSPLITLLIFSIGPLSNVASLLFETISMYFITKRFGKMKDTYAIEILGFSGQYQNFLTVIGMFFGQCFITRIGSLIGSGQRDTAIRMTSDILKLTILTTFVYDIIMFFVLKPMLKFVGTPN